MNLVIENIDKALLASSISDISGKLEQMYSKSWWWDFTVPIITAAIVAVIASGFTYLITKKLQDKSDKAAAERYSQNQLIERENSNREAINEVILLANSCYTTLIAIRDNYSNRLTTDLHERILEVPVIKGVIFGAVDFRVLTRLFFVTPRKEESVKKWSQITQMEMMFSNYNTLMAIWEERNALRQDYQDKVFAEGLHNVEDVKEISKNIPPYITQCLIQTTERCISLTSELQIDLDDFIGNFKEAFDLKLNKKLPKDLLVDVFHVDDENLAKRREIFSKEAKADFSVMKSAFPNENIFQQFIQSMKSRHDT
jgi:hypothetical protein